MVQQLLKWSKMIFMRKRIKASHYLTRMRQEAYYTTANSRIIDDEGQHPFGAAKVVAFGVIDNEYFSITKREAAREIEYMVKSCLRLSILESYPIDVQAEFEDNMMFLSFTGALMIPLPVLGKAVEFFVSEAARYNAGWISCVWRNLSPDQGCVSSFFRQFGFRVVVKNDNVTADLRLEACESSSEGNEPNDIEVSDAGKYLAAVQRAEHPMPLTEGMEYTELQEFLLLEGCYCHISKAVLAPMIRLALKELDQEHCGLDFRLEDAVIEISAIRSEPKFARFLRLLIHWVLLEATNHEVVLICGAPYLEEEIGRIAAAVFSEYDFLSNYEDNRLILKLVI